MNGECMQLVHVLVRSSLELAKAEQDPSRTAARSHIARRVDEDERNLFEHPGTLPGALGDALDAFRDAYRRMDRPCEEADDVDPDELDRAVERLAVLLEVPGALAMHQTREGQRKRLAAITRKAHAELLMMARCAPLLRRFRSDRIADLDAYRAATRKLANFLFDRYCAIDDRTVRNAGKAVEHLLVVSMRQDAVGAEARAKLPDALDELREALEADGPAN